MADAAAAQFLVDSLGQLVTYHVKLISNASEEIEQLTKDLNYFNAFLKYAVSKKTKDHRVKQFLRQIREALYDAEDVVDAFVTQTLSSKSKNWLKRVFADNVKLDGIAQEVQKVREVVSQTYGDKDEVDLLLRSLGDDGIDKPEAPPVREKNVVGLEEDTAKIIEILKKDTPRLDIVSIVGMPGLGKSTLAGKIFRDPLVQFEFPTRLWVYVSKFTPKDIFISILREFMAITDDIRSMKEHELAMKVKAQLDRGKFLIVMDDVWTPEEWKKVAAALPEANFLGKIIITSRYVDVANAANAARQPYKMDFLKDEASVQLLQYEVFGEPRWDPQFESHGKIIAHNCKGLPLAIVVIGGIISKKLAAIADDAGKATAWEKFSGRVNTYLQDDPTQMMEKVISLSYDKLPYHWRSCFLYFGMFPEDIEILTWKLFRMWSAEGFISKKMDFSLEETAENYLDDLISRNLVMVGKRSSDGKVKTCRIHDSLRDFCKAQAGNNNENFFEEIRKSSDGNLVPSVSNDKEYRRLCIHSNISAFVSSKPCGRRVRSFVCFSKEELALQSDQISAIPGGFKLLRVMDVKPLRFTKIPADIYDLLHLRYIHLSFNSAILPPAFSKLWNMETLIVDTSQRVLEIKADIWKMRHLRHLKTNTTATLPEPTKASGVEISLIQTLGTIAPENCTDKVLDRACNVKRVSIRGNLNTLLDRNNSSGASFENMVKLRELEKLKLQNDVFPLPPSEGQLTRLPPSNTFPPLLRILTLSDTFLNWREMKVLASLRELRVLKLKEKAFMGNHWEVDGKFIKLEVLCIGRTDLVVWKASAGHFPVLGRLELQYCEELREVPDEFVKIESLKVLNLNRCPSAATSAKKIETERKKVLPEFSLTIFPPIKE